MKGAEPLSDKRGVVTGLVLHHANRSEATIECAEVFCSDTYSAANCTYSVSQSHEIRMKCSEICGRN
jgi:hypothetical protein